MTDWTSTASVLFAGAGLVFTGRQVQVLTQDRKKERQLEVQGVCVSWLPELTPRPNEVLPDDTAAWRYVVSVYNPGRFAISQVQVELEFAMPVRRLRGDHLEGEVRTLHFSQPVIAGGATRPWTRTIRINREAAARLEETTAVVTFIGFDGRQHTNAWPKVAHG